MQCAHELCTCDVAGADLFCGPTCLQGVDTETCMCGHADCESSSGRG